MTGPSDFVEKLSTPLGYFVKFDVEKTKNKMTKSQVEDEL